MKRFSLLLLLATFSFGVKAQTNESHPALYKWKGKSTEMQEGYVILKSGARMEGMISLRGAEGHVEEITIDTGEKKIDLPPAALKAYGLNAKIVFQDATAGKYEWKNVGESMGKVIEKTKPRMGYVIDQQDKRYEGELQLKRVDGTITQATVKAPNEKFKFDIQDIKKYDVLLTIAEWSKDGEKIYKQDGRNFTPGTIKMKNGEEKEGWVAFKFYTSGAKMNTYNTIMYCPTETAVVELVKDEEADYMNKTLADGSVVSYQRFENAFVSSADMEDQEYKDPSREFNPGSAILVDGSTLTGEIAQTKSRRFYSKEIVIKLTTGELLKKGVGDVTSFTQNFEDAEHTYIVEQDAFVELEFDSPLFKLIRNPHPTTVNPSATKFAKTGISVGARETQLQALKMTRWEQAVAAVSDEEKPARRERIQEAQAEIRKKSTEELEAYKVEMMEGRTEQEMQDHINNEQTSAALQYAYVFVDSEITFRKMISAARVFYKEWLIVNKSDGTTSVIYKQDFKDQIEPVLMGCLDYLTMEKADQKKYKDWDNLHMTLEFMQKCYSGN